MLKPRHNQLDHLCLSPDEGVIALQNGCCIVSKIAPQRPLRLARVSNLTQRPDFSISTPIAEVHVRIVTPADEASCAAMSRSSDPASTFGGNSSIGDGSEAEGSHLASARHFEDEESNSGSSHRQGDHVSNRSDIGEVDHGAPERVSSMDVDSSPPMVPISRRLGNAGPPSALSAVSVSGSVDGRGVDDDVAVGGDSPPIAPIHGVRWDLGDYSHFASAAAPPSTATAATAASAQHPPS